MSKHTLWLRSESKPLERRTPLIPAHARLLVKMGLKVVVESSLKRIFSNKIYKSSGCEIVDKGSWKNAPKGTFVLGIKELPNSSLPLKHTHIYFAHCFKSQEGSQKLLTRFKKGSGTLYDLEYLRDNRNRRLVSFGVSSGMAGAALGLLVWYYKQRGLKSPYDLPLFFANKYKLYDRIQQEITLSEGLKPSVILIGRYGRCGSGVKKILSEFDIPWTPWGREDTRSGGPFKKILEYDIFYNCVYVKEPIAPFLDQKLLNKNKKLSLIVDISCDPNGPYNPLPIYQEGTTFLYPTLDVKSSGIPLELIAIDHLPALIPYESSIRFSEQLYPYLEKCLNGEDLHNVWQRSKNEFHTQLDNLGAVDND